MGTRAAAVPRGYIRSVRAVSHGRGRQRQPAGRRVCLEPELRAGVRTGPAHGSAQSTRRQCGLVRRGGLLQLGRQTKTGPATTARATIRGSQTSPNSTDVRGIIPVCTTCWVTRRTGRPAASSIRGSTILVSVLEVLMNLPKCVVTRARRNAAFPRPKWAFAAAVNN